MIIINAFTNNNTNNNKLVNNKMIAHALTYIINVKNIINNSQAAYLKRLLHYHNCVLPYCSLSNMAKHRTHLVGNVLIFKTS